MTAPRRSGEIGRRTSLRGWRPKGRGGSSPPFDTIVWRCFRRSEGLRRVWITRSAGYLSSFCQRLRLIEAPSDVSGPQFSNRARRCFGCEVAGISNKGHDGYMMGAPHTRIDGTIVSHMETRIVPAGQFTATFFLAPADGTEHAVVASAEVVEQGTRRTTSSTSRYRTSTIRRGGRGRDGTSYERGPRQHQFRPAGAHL